MNIILYLRTSPVDWKSFSVSTFSRKPDTFLSFTFSKNSEEKLLKVSVDELARMFLEQVELLFILRYRVLTFL